MSRATTQGSAGLTSGAASPAGLSAENITVSSLTRAFRDLAHAAADDVLVHSLAEARALAEAARGLADSARADAAAGACGLARADANFAAALAAAARDTAARARSMAEAANAYERRLTDEDAPTARYQEPGSPSVGLHEFYHTEPAFPTAVNDSVRYADLSTAEAGDDAGRTRAAKLRSVAGALAASAQARADDRANKIVQLAREADAAAAEASRAAEDAVRAADSCSGTDGAK
ncbi:hypothetical protein [Nocardia niwae]|uniref:hypothetical protein n=1 Tax=Nocardia niwae TaxID=626084 RepID=UPI0007A4F33F|nr:hypothetical protein [Nocardia niwae]